MLARKLPRTTSQLTSLTRTFTSTSLSRNQARSPALGDVQPGGAEAYNARQKEFRDGLEAARKRKEQAERQSLNATPRDQPKPLDPISFPAETASLGIGSLSIAHTGEARQAETEAATSNRRKGPLSNLIYGTPEGRQMDKEMERSFSEVLARGKYVHSIVFHQVKPDKVDEYVQLVGQWYPKMANMRENKVNLVGSWRTEVGECDTFGLYFIPSLLLPLTFVSPHLGVPAIHRLPRLPPFDPIPS